MRSLGRGLAILRFINVAGDARPGEIAAALGIPRPTVYRLLRTLEEEGYVALSATNNRVRVTRLAAALGDGFAMTSRVCQAAGPVFAAHAATLVWPLDISVCENAAMVIQETTHGRSPLSIDRGMTGFRLPMLRTAAGRAYLAHCGEAERALVLQQIHRLADPADLPFLEAKALAAMLASGRETGLGVRQAGEFRAATSSIAAPVLIDGAAVAAVSLIWTRQAMTVAEAIHRYANPLRGMADEIARRAGSEESA